MRFVGAGVGECDLEHRHQLEIERALAQVAQLDLAELDVVFGADPDRGVGVDLGPGRVETHPVCVVGALVVRGRVGCRVLGQRHGLRLAVPAQVEEAAMPVTQGIVAPARDAEAAPAAPAGAVGAQRHAVAAVGKQVGGRQRGDTRQHLAQQAGCAAFLLVGRRAGWRCEQHRHFAWRTFVQQRRHRFHMRVAHTPAPRRAVQQHVGNGHDAHALVVRHEGVDAGEAHCRSLACSAEIERFDKTVTRPRGQRFERCEVRYRAVRLDLRCKRSGVRRDHQFVGRGAAQGQAWHTLRCVLVGQRVVTRGVGRLGNAPGHVVFAREADLLVQRGEAGAVQHAALWFFEHQRRHQVLEHRTRPRAQAGVFTDRIERPAERGPVAHRHVALGDGQQAGQARFRRQQVVIARVELLLGDSVADVEQAALAVVQETEVGFPGQCFAARRHGAQALHGEGRGRLRQAVEQRTAQRGNVVSHAPRELVQCGGCERRSVAGQQRHEFFGGAAQQAFEVFGRVECFAQRLGQREQPCQRTVGQGQACSMAQRLDAGA